jgi:hypothetical protein
MEDGGYVCRKGNEAANRLILAVLVLCSKHSCQRLAKTSKEKKEEEKESQVEETVKERQMAKKRWVWKRCPEAAQGVKSGKACAPTRLAFHRQLVLKALPHPSHSSSHLAPGLGGLPQLLSLPRRGQLSAFPALP